MTELVITDEGLLREFMREFKLGSIWKIVLKDEMREGRLHFGTKDCFASRAEISWVVLEAFKRGLI